MTALNTGDRLTATMIIAEFDKNLLQHFDVPAWNSFVDALLTRDLIPPAWSKGERPPVLAVTFNFQGLKRAHYHLDGIDLTLCWLQNADFTGASLKNARLGCGTGVSYREARLDGADFRFVEISDCDFTGSTGIDTALWDDAAYDPERPPLGLPPEALARCKAEADPPPDNPRKPRNPAEPTGFHTAPLRCCVTIHHVPIEER